MTDSLSSPRISAIDLDVGYGDTAVIRDLTTTIPEASLTILVGSNGCGKSTLLKTFARIIVPANGSVLLDGNDIHRLPTREVARKLGLLPQGPITPEGLTVSELVAQGRFPHQSLLRQWSSKDEAAVSKAMAMAQISELADRQVDTLSGGQRQRCWIAMVLAQETDLILLDEPTTFLDLKVQVDVMNLLSTLAHDGGKTLVVVLHELNLAAAYADHLIMMKDGKVVCAGAPASVFTASSVFDVFGLEARILRDPHSGSLVCVPATAPLSNEPNVIRELIS